jgi:hypothetical protein
LKRFGQAVAAVVEFVARYLEPLSAIVVASIVLYDEHTGRIKTLRDLSEATVAVLLILAVGVLRDRHGRELTRKAVAGLSASVDTAVREVLSDYPYEQRNLCASWDIRSPQYAEAVRTKDLRFTRNNVSSIVERSRPDGSIEEGGYVILGGYPKGTMEELVHAPTEASDGTIEVVVLTREWMRYETMRVETRRKLVDSFTPGKGLNVRLLIDHPTDVVKLTLIWPTDKPPSRGSVRLTRILGGTETPHPVPEPVKRNGRVTLKDVEILDPRTKEILHLAWRW